MGLSKIKKHLKPGDEKLMQFDFIGVQYYFRIVAQYSLFPPILFAKQIPAEKREETNTMRIELLHKGLYKMLNKFNKYKNIDTIYITETGVCLDDTLVGNKVNDVKRINT
jgi:beta-glucosidase